MLMGEVLDIFNPSAPVLANIGVNRNCAEYHA